MDPAALKPANHKMVSVTASVYAGDSQSSVASVVLTSVVSSEADNSLGDGDTAEDIQQAEYGTADTRFLLRAERAGRGSGRTYTVTYTALDQAGNQTVSQAIVTVPHHCLTHSVSRVCLRAARAKTRGCHRAALFSIGQAILEKYNNIHFIIIVYL
ncbi:hypothetical protein ACP26L_18720 [Paenibacillus sp. S-38]|uniref:hypothetical protein n=1 Tax=Paenibacillus sp. S-38 TaxID=3416710 RepID=UPI003CF99DBB